MKIGIGLPIGLPGIDAKLVLEWAEKADAGPFSSVATLDRMAYSNFEPLISLASAAAVTRRVRLTTSILLAPLRNAAALAKQAATLDVISGGRLSLGVGIGGRENDYRAAGVAFNRRGRHLDERLALMKRVWSGESVGDGVGPVGPPPIQPGGPELLIGASSPAAMRRVGRWADGYIAVGTADAISRDYSLAGDSWQAHARPGAPRLVGSAYFALGPDALGRGAPAVRDWYAIRGRQEAEAVVRDILTTPQAVTDIVESYAAVGMDELILQPTIASLDQVDRLADTVG